MMRQIKMIPLRTHYFYYLALSVVFFSCANIVAPTGGPKDVTPPRIIKAEPENNTSFFSGNTIRLYFDEFIQLKDENRLIMISPPPDTMPDTKVKGKSMVMNIPGHLKRNTTYSISFGTAIQDFNEGNPLKDFTYVFSTGNHIDSLSLAGKVLNAEDLTPASKVMVMLYDQHTDSVVYKEKPRYVARPDEQGFFRFDHLAGGAYTLIALQDDNNDLLVSLPSEKIAFSDSLIHPVYHISEVDSSKRDSLQIPPTDQKANELFLFKQTDSTLRFLKAYLEKPYQLVLPFSLPVKNLEIKTIGNSSSLGNDWYLPEWSKNHDTLTCWIHDPFTTDSLIFTVKDGEKITDTVRLDLNRFGKGGKYRKGKDKIGKLSASINVASTISPEDILKLKFSYPIKEVKDQNLTLITSKDTITLKAIFTDSLRRDLIIKHKWLESTSYQLIIPKGVFSDWTGEPNDSLVYKFATLSLQDYGNLIINFEGTEPGQYILQLLDDKGKFIEETVVNDSGRWNLKFMKPGKYRVKAILDKNKNSHWDSGNFRFKIQPEKISFYPKTLDIRANWDLEEYWKW